LKQGRKGEWHDFARRTVPADQDIFGEEKIEGVEVTPARTLDRVAQISLEI
jgi:hypothetical protein